MRCWTESCKRRQAIKGSLSTCLPVQILKLNHNKIPKCKKGKWLTYQYTKSSHQWLRASAVEWVLIPRHYSSAFTWLWRKASGNKKERLPVRSLRSHQHLLKHTLYPREQCPVTQDAVPKLAHYWVFNRSFYHVTLLDVWGPWLVNWIPLSCTYCYVSSTRKFFFWLEIKRGIF